MGCYSSLTETLSLAPRESITETLANPAPSGRQEALRRSSANPTGAPFTSHLSGGTPPDAFKARRAVASRGFETPRSTRDPSSGNVILSGAFVVEAIVLGASLRACRSGGGSPAVVATSAFGGIGTGSGSPPKRAKASNRIGAAAVRPTSPGTAPLSGRPIHTPIVTRRSKPTAQASR